ncbi:hypothetical protein K491DRAFT_687619 [Lophiostoma macrostomum CBS 122681]|uniref:Ribosomal protein L9 domain-containing protein n=1 Tax=Lophiostoma macrostomum CBS 122681 TaxID=1314788 RepID=A0A6A6TMV0_9PLEO|nr:hypothetical protein K491DRAFT_687619 [Lophiostoma macrostomum CBS 122681]
MTRLGLHVGGPLQQVRGKSKAAREAERNIVVKLIQDVPRFGRAGTYVPLNPAQMRNRWFPKRIADYVPAVQLKQLKAEGTVMGRDFDFGMLRARQAGDEEGPDEVRRQPKNYVRPVELDFLSPARSMELLTTFMPSTLDFARQPIEQEKVEARPQPRYGASNAADILTAAAMAAKPKTPVNGIYGSVSTSDVAASIRTALAHNEEAARVILADSHISFIDGPEGDSARVKQLGSFKVEIKIPGADSPITRSVRIRAKKDDLAQAA